VFLTKRTITETVSWWTTDNRQSLFVKLEAWPVMHSLL